jgi:hypothetical protein
MLERVLNADEVMRALDPHCHPAGRKSFFDMPATILIHIVS